MDFDNPSRASWVAPDLLVPLQTPHIKRLCHLAACDHGAAALLVDALARAPLALLLDERCSGRRPGEPTQGWTTRGLDDLIPASVPLPGGKDGRTELANVVLTDYRFHGHAHVLDPTADTFCTMRYAGRSFLNLLAEYYPPMPLVVDPGTEHCIVIGHALLRQVLRDLGTTLPATRYLGRELVIEGCSNVPPVLQARIDAFLSQFDDIAVACLVRVRDSTPEKALILMIDCEDEVLVRRVKDALPLLGWGLEEKWSPRAVVGLHGDQTEMFDCVDSPLYRARQPHRGR